MSTKVGAIPGKSASARASINNRSTKSLMRSADVWHTCSAFTYSLFSRGRLSANSAWPRNTAKGVRSSCDASAVKDVCLAKAFSSRSKVLFKTPAKSRNSKSTFAVSILPPKLFALNPDAVFAMARNGLKICREIHHCPNSPSPIIPRPAKTKFRSIGSSLRFTGSIGVPTIITERPGPKICNSRYSPFRLNQTPPSSNSGNFDPSGRPSPFNKCPSASQTPKYCSGDILDFGGNRSSPYNCSHTLGGNIGGGRRFPINSPSPLSLPFPSFPLLSFPLPMPTGLAGG